MVVSQNGGPPLLVLKRNSTGNHIPGEVPNFEIGRRSL